MELNSIVEQLGEKYSPFSWYDSVGVDKSGRFVVYVHYITKEVMETVCHQFGGKQVLIMYAYANPKNRVRCVNLYDFSKPLAAASSPDLHANVIEADELDLDYLILELDRLEKLCGTNALQDIFFEIHDGKNAVTSVGKKYPDVKESMQKLYDTFGFDLIYENMDG